MGKLVGVTRAPFRLAGIAATGCILFGFTLAALPARAADPVSLRLTVPGDAGPSSGTWHGQPLSGQADPTGPPSPACFDAECDRVQLIIEADDPNYAATHVVTSTVSLQYDDSAGHVFDIALLDGSRHLLKAINHVAPNQPLVFSGLQIDHYYVEVDSDVAVRPTAYSGSVVLTATPAPRVVGLAAPHLEAAPAVYSSDATAVGVLGVREVAPTIGPGVTAPAVQQPSRTSTFGEQPAFAPASAQSPAGGLSTGAYALIALAVVAVGWLIRQFRRAWARAGTPTG